MKCLPTLLVCIHIIIVYTNRKIVHYNMKCPVQLILLRLDSFSQVARKKIAMNNLSCKGKFKLQFKLLGIIQVAIQIAMNIVSLDYFSTSDY